MASASINRVVSARGGGVSLTAMALQLSGGAALAQTTDTTEARGAGLEEIVVTARKRGEELLQDVPITITAISGEQLAALGAVNFDEFAYQVPGLTFSDEGAGQKRYV